MENLGTVLSEIVALTTTIETDYPELYRFLDEEPVTLLTEREVPIDQQTMQANLQSSKQLLKIYTKTHGTH